MSKRIPSFVLIPFLAGLPALATENLFGLQGSLGVPTGTFGDSAHLDRKVGLGLGFQMPIDFGGGQVLRPRFDYLAFSRDASGINYKADALVLMADYNYHFSGKREGVYVIGGLGLHSTRRDLTQLTGSARETTTGFAYNVGLGYGFNANVGLELKLLGLNMNGLSYQPLGTDPAFMGNSVVASVNIIF